jgi:hypothetical protein
MFQESHKNVPNSRVAIAEHWKHANIQEQEKVTRGKWVHCKINVGLSWGLDFK